MPRISVANGRVTSRDASSLGEGELTVAQDCYYVPANPALRSILGRTAFNATAMNPIIGAGYLGFDNGASLIVALQRGATKYKVANPGVTPGAIGETGTFEDMIAASPEFDLAGTATIMDQAHYRDSHTIVNGVDRARTVYNTGRPILLGMLANTAAPTVSRDAGVGTGFTLTSGSTITYWVEERAEQGTPSVITKRNATLTSSNTVTLTGDGTLDKPVVTRPALVNTSGEVTHWALMATATNGAFPIGAEIAQVAIGTTTIEDTRTGTDPGLPSGSAFSIVSLSIGGITLNVPKYGPPPIGDTIDVFEDALIMNDNAFPSEMAFCFTDDIHAWNSSFRIKFSTKYHDKVVAVRSLDNFAIVLLQNGVWRVNTLPKSSDQAFETERVKSEIEGAFGCVNAKATAKFSFGEGIRLAYVSRYGVIVTDGTRWGTISEDMDWESEVAIEHLDKCRLLNNPRAYRLEFTYVPLGGTLPTRTAFLHYHPSHAKPSPTGGIRANMTWPINRDANDAFLGKIGDVDVVFSANENGKIYRHDSGFTEPVMFGGIDFKVRTMDDYPGDVGSHATLRDLWTHHQASAGQSATVRIIQRNSGQADDTGTAVIPLDYREATPCGKQGLAEAFQYEFEVANPTTQIYLDYFMPDYDFAGKTEEK